MTPDDELKRVTHQLTVAQIAWLDTFARTLSVSRSQALRHIVDAFVTRYEIVVDEPSEENEKRP